MEDMCGNEYSNAEPNVALHIVVLCASALINNSAYLPSLRYLVAGRRASCARTLSWSRQVLYYINIRLDLILLVSMSKVLNQLRRYKVCNLVEAVVRSSFRSAHAAITGNLSFVRAVLPIGSWCEVVLSIRWHSPRLLGNPRYLKVW